jgi:LPS O-antigen subunit length determinant protein (WzzB/FepE family)
VVVVVERQGRIAQGLAVGLVAAALLQAWEAAEILQRPRLQQFKVMQVETDQTLRLTMAVAVGVDQMFLQE